jgi:hypothetical protein
MLLSERVLLGGFFCTGGAGSGSAAACGASGPAGVSSRLTLSSDAKELFDMRCVAAADDFLLCLGEVSAGVPPGLSSRSLWPGSWRLEGVRLVKDRREEVSTASSNVS